MTQSRRTFLQHTAGAAVMGGVLHRSLGRDLMRTAPAELVPEITEAMLREYALAAVDAAKQLGATFADVRVHLTHGLTISGGDYLRGAGKVKPPERWPAVVVAASYNIRAIAGGTWGFASGTTLSRDDVVKGARIAVDAARSTRPRHRSAFDMAPMPIEQGEWTMPVAIDPFTVPLIEQRNAAQAALDKLVKYPEVTNAGIMLDWRRAATVFASTEGTVLLQRRWLAMPRGTVRAQANPESWQTSVEEEIATIRIGPLGYEAYGVELLDQGVQDAAELAIKRSKQSLQSVSAEVGRNEIVFGPAAVAAMLNTTILPALDLNRALGYHANAEGTSFAAPPADVLGKMRLASPLLTVKCDRSRPGAACTTMWDEEGVRPEEYTVVTEGIVTDYHTDRQTATELRDWYASHGGLRAHGCMRMDGHWMPEVRVPNVTMMPGKDATTVDDMIAGTKKGYFVEGCSGNSDQQLINSQYRTVRSGVRKIVNGKLSSYVDDFAFQFISQGFWKGVTAIGGEATVREDQLTTDLPEMMDIVELYPNSTFRTVPMHVREVNVLNVGRTA